MALFKRKNQDTTEEVPPEVQEYYQAEKRERTGVAWLLAIATLVVTVLLAAALFFGGRWVYQNVFNNEDSAQETSSTSTDTDAILPSDTEEASESDDEGDTSTTPPDSEDPETSPSSPAPGQAGTSAPGSGDNGTPGSGQATGTPTTGADEEPLPETGPADTLAIFLAVTIFAYVIHYAAAAKSRG